ncbi:hypothetical protein MHIR_DE00374 [Candidatus Doolittlea endobia]|uniref:Uncharacterized protein n=1 Tax=Candidatus Doolittlea endobia TaxID=1778262 RepID=A0A143WSF8_9ENTR|nr:hypothetical protein MHIR_DE00374 [Candidatus Doolittlea endobia]
MDSVCKSDKDFVKLPFEETPDFKHIKLKLTNNDMHYLIRRFFCRDPLMQGRHDPIFFEFNIVKPGKLLGSENLKR